ncbi:MFS transporter [Sphingomonas nostoxanthinifaciens]|uniref:MFS transporter n=1 Tax=Sphingomonas nostoxanthinifaciens TaxID=2872652 RepID=UPI001CC1F42E|nr:MFS transporter [Sphingomonas nostoxanthinifaciens]UAK25595.1 MFS transporter [Sphingomonas nostoxanthinifaciens]
MADKPASARLLLLAILAGTAMASNYVLQPVLPEVARSFPASPWITSLAAGAGPLGYMLGLVLLVPLGDGLSIRTLVAVQAVALAAVLALAAVTTIEPLFLAALLLGGMASRVTAHCIALAGRVRPEAQGRAVGTVVMGVSAGILAGRVLSGALATSFGWRAPLAMIAGLTALGGFGIVLAVPTMPASDTLMRVPDLLLAVPKAHASNPELRRATLVGCC